MLYKFKDNIEEPVSFEIGTLNNEWAFLEFPNREDIKSWAQNIRYKTWIPYLHEITLVSDFMVYQIFWMEQLL